MKLYNHCVVILILLWLWIGSFAVILYNHCVVILMLLFRELAVCWDTIQSLCGDINVTLSFELAALLWYYTIIVWWYYCYFAVWIGSLAVILYNHCIVILMLLWPWIGSFAVILYNHFVVIFKLLCRLNWQLYCDTIKALCGDIKITLPFELAAFLWYNTIIV